MHINLIAIGNKMPAWIKAGYDEYAKRLPLDYRIQLIEIPTIKRNKSSSLTQLNAQEGSKLLAAVETSGPIISLDRQGRLLSTEEWVKKLLHWHDHCAHINVLVGGPEGLSDDCLKKSQEVVSLSALTFPHPLVRVILAEQIYRAWSIITHHPYHRSN